MIRRVPVAGAAAVLLSRISDVAGMPAFVGFVPWLDGPVAVTGVIVAGYLSRGLVGGGVIS